MSDSLTSTLFLTGVLAYLFFLLLLVILFILLLFSFQVTVQENLSTDLLPSTSQPLDSSLTRRSSGAGTKREEASQTASETRKMEKRDEKSSSENCVASLFSKAAAETTTKFLPSSQPAISVTSVAPPQDVFKFGVSSSNSASKTFEFIPKPSSTSLAG